MLSRLFIFLLAILFTGQLAAQQKEFLYKNLTQEEGLPSNEVYYIFRDSKDYLWIATDKGVVRYNGSKMERFELPDNVVFKILENDGRIWFFSLSGSLAYFYNGKIHSFIHNREIVSKLDGNTITNAYIDSSKNIFLNSLYGKNYIISPKGTVKIVNYYDQKTVISIKEISPGVLFASRKKFSYALTNLEVQLTISNRTTTYYIPIKVLDNNHLTAAVMGKNGSAYFFIGKFIFRLDKDGSYIKHSLPSDVFCLCVDKSQTVYAGTRNDGLFSLTTSLQEISHVKSLAGKRISCITSDNENGIWVSTIQDGVFYIKNPAIRRLAYFSQHSHISNRIYTFRDSLLFFGNTTGIYKLAGENIDLIYSSNAAVRIYNFFAQPLGNNLYVALRNASVPDKFEVRKEKGGSSGFDNIYDLGNYVGIIEISPDSLMVYSSNAIEIFRNKPPYNNLKRIVAYRLQQSPYRDFQKKILLSRLNGIYQVSENWDSLVPFLSSSPLFKQGASCINQLPNGLYTIGIRFGGIAIVKDSTVLKHITIQNGLVDNAVVSLLPVRDDLWVATAKGISVIHFTSFYPIQYTIRTIGKNEGLYNLNIYQLASF